VRVGLLSGAIVLLFYCGPASSQPDLQSDVQAIADKYIRDRAGPEKISAVAVHVQVKDKLLLDSFSGTFGNGDNHPVDERTLFEIGSNTKHFTAALILLLEARGVLNIDQTVGQWLPQYPDWSKVTIRSLLNMTSPIPNYSETVAVGRAIAANIHRQFDLKGLVNAVYGKNLPTPDGWFYSNTNTVLAGMIVEAATHMSFRQALDTMILKPMRLHNTFYFDQAFPPRVQKRMPSAFYENAACQLYQPLPCDVPVLAPLVGAEVSTMNMSWAGPAGAITATPRDLARWVDDLFGLRVIPSRQLKEMTALVSTETGQPIADVSVNDPNAFGLGLGRKYSPNGSFWFYEGITFGYRTIFAYWPQYNLLITTSTNSQPADGQDKLAPAIVVKVFDLLQKDGLINVSVDTDTGADR
jgi:D-alanyl-D-alanine carboxypeptidase